jgi:GT2 family glycosyltransferase
MDEKKIIAICVATYKRPELLKNCLKFIGLISVPDNYTPIIIIVDNDSNRSGEASYIEISNNINLESYYYVEPERGISSARNRLLKEAINHQATFIGFIDDDEFPHKDWLINHMITLNKFNADVVAGPVIPTLANEPVNLNAINVKFNSGHTPRHVAAGNVLFKTNLVTEGNLSFDTRYNFTGGEDFNFFDRSSAVGNTHTWAADAIVYEIIPEERRTKKYLFFRHFTGGINNVIQYRMNNSALSTWAHFLLKATGKILDSLITLILYITTFKEKRLEKCIIKAASSFGYLSGLLNIIVERYR